MKLLFLLIFAVLLSLSCHASKEQGHRYFYKAGEALMQRNTQRAMELYRNAREKYEEDNYQRGIAVANFELAKIYKSQGEFEQALELLEQSLEYFTPGKEGRANIIFDKAKIFISLGKYKQALKLLASVKEFDSYTLKGEYYTLKGRAYMHSGLIEDGEKHLDSALSYSDFTIKSSIYSLFSFAAAKKGNYDKAMEYHNLSVEFADTANPNDQVLAIINHLELLQLSGRKISIDQLSEARSKIRKMENASLKAESQLELAKLFLTLEHKSEACEMISETILSGKLPEMRKSEAYLLLTKMQKTLRFTSSLYDSLAYYFASVETDIKNERKEKSILQEKLSTFKALLINKKKSETQNFKWLGIAFAAFVLVTLVLIFVLLAYGKKIRNLKAMMISIENMPDKKFAKATASEVRS